MESKKDRERNFESYIKRLEEKIESLKIQYNLFFSGEINIPPEQERELLEKEVRTSLYSNLKSPKINLLIQNLSSRFNIFNNMWKKKLNQLESGELKRPSKPKPAFFIKDKPANKESVIPVSLNDEKSFEQLFDRYSSLGSNKNKKSKDALINKIKLKLISENIINAKIQLSKSDGKIKLKIKK